MTKEYNNRNYSNNRNRNRNHKPNNRIKHFVTIYEREFIIDTYNNTNHKYRELKSKQDDLYNHYKFDEGDRLEDTLAAYLKYMKQLKRRFKFSFAIPKSLMIDGVV